MIDREQSYSIPEIRGVLQTFDHAGLVALCQDLADKFPGLSRNVGLGRGLREDEIINMILDFFRRHDDFAPLVAAVEARQPRQDILDAPRENVAQVTILLESDFGKFTTTKQDSFIFALSCLLNVSPKQIRILHVAPASVLITLEMPEQAARHLVSMYLANDSALQTLHIKKVELQKSKDFTETVVAAEPSPIWHRRLRDLADSIAQALGLLKQYEDALLYEDDPRRQARHLHEVERLRESLAHYKREYQELEAEISGSLPATMQDVAVKMQQMDEKLERRRLRQTLLDRYKADEQSTVTIPVEHLEQAHLATVQDIFDALEADQVPDALMRQALDAVRQVLVALSERSTALPGQQAIADAIVEPTLDVKHKLKLTLPIIPMLLSYEGELELGSEVNVERAWKRLEMAARPPYSRLLLVSIITALAFGLVYNVLASTWQLTMPQRLITTGVFGLAPAMTLWLGFRLARVSTPKIILIGRITLTVIGALFIAVGLVWTAWTIVKPSVQVPLCLELDLVTGSGQNICPDDKGVLVLPAKSLDRLQNLSGRAILTHARGCTCDWEGQTKEGQPLTKLGGPTRDCSFSFGLPDRPTAVYYLTLTVGEQRRLFTISVQR